ncbi:MAG TPA: glycosyltransferase family 39 protein [Solirubrobacteraceae bacterium]|jgi:4-amino-4-deoxy-L-arabinose transferase-like glycosyltransferase
MPTIPKSLRPRLSRLAPATAPAAPAPTGARRRPEALDRPRPRAATRRRALPFPELGALLLLAGVLNLWALDRNGWANQYYSAAVRSMSTSWHNFLYDSFDPSGLMTVDKPPLALWVQALSARVFGFHSWSILVPQALMGVATVALVYDLTRRLWGRTAGFVAGLVLAVTPITVAISRHNNPDALLALCCVGALWCLVRALQDGRTRWIVLAGVCVGLGFETKMGAALLVVPAIVAAWLWVAPRGRLTAIRQLLAGGAAMVVVGGAWPLLMMLTPASSRPWISGTSDNSILSLITNYNGLGRLDGQAGGPQIAGGGGGRGGSTTFGGATGPLRLFNEGLGGQAGWLLGFAVVALVALAVVTRLRRADARTGWLVAAGGTFLTIAVAFSFAQGIFHPYYVAQLAPFTAVLVGAGAGWFLTRHRAAGIAAAVALAAGVATELLVLHNLPGQLTWLPAVLLVAGAVTAVALVAVRGPLRAAVLAAALGLLLIAPASWAVQTLGHATNGTFPAGGPAQVGFGGGPGRGGPGGGAPGGGFGAPPGAGTRPAAPPAGTGGRFGGATGGARPGGAGGGMGGGFGGDTAGLTQAVTYASQHGGGAIAVSSQSGAAASIIQSGANVAGIGGFSGRESQVSTTWLANAVRNGQVRWVLTSGSATGGFGGNDGRVGSSQVMAAVAQVGRKVTITSGSSTTTLYDLSGQADALAAAGS